MRSYRLAAQVTWNGVIDIIGDQGQERLPALLRSATHVWHAIDRQAVAAADAYRRRENELLGRTNQHVNAMLDALLEGRADSAVAGVAADALGLPEHGRYAVVTTRLPAQPDRVHRPDEIGGLRFLWRMRPDLEMAVVHLGDRELDDLVAALTPVVCTSAGVSPVVDSLADLGTARRLAEVAMRTCSGPRRRSRGSTGGCPRPWWSASRSWPSASRAASSARSSPHPTAACCSRRWRRGCAARGLPPGRLQSSTATATPSSTGCAASSSSPAGRRPVPWTSSNCPSPSTPSVSFPAAEITRLRRRLV